MATDALSSIPVHSSVIRRLRSLKTANQTWDDFLLDMAEDYAPEAWYSEIERRRSEGVDVPGEKVIQRSRELARKGR